MAGFAGKKSDLYRERLKNREFGEGGASDFLAGTSGIAKGKTRSEDKKCEAMPTRAKTDSSITSGITETILGGCFQVMNTLGSGFLESVYTQMHSKVGFWLRRLRSKFLIFTHALPFGNGRSLQMQKFARPPGQIPNF